MLEGDVSPWKLNCKLQHNRRFGHFIPFMLPSLFILIIRNQLISSLGNVYSLGFSVCRRAGLGTAMQSQSSALNWWVSLALFPDCVFIENILVQMAPAHFYCSSTLTWTSVHSHMQECRSPWSADDRPVQQRLEADGRALSGNNVWRLSVTIVPIKICSKCKWMEWDGERQNFLKLVTLGLGRWLND